MNETEELALDTVPTGGPKEVLTEQANNNPEVQVSEALPLPAEESRQQHLVCLTAK